MAWLYKHPKSGRWFLGWRVGKKAFNRSTGATDRKEAEKQLTTARIMVSSNREGKLTEAVYGSLTGNRLGVSLLSQQLKIIWRIRLEPSLGTALLGYYGFQNFGIRIVGAFDHDPKIIEKWGANHHEAAIA